MARCVETVHWLVYTPSLELYLVTIDEGGSNIYIEVSKVESVGSWAEIIAVRATSSIDYTHRFQHTKQNDIGFIDFVKRLLENSTLIAENIEQYCE